MTQRPRAAEPAADPPEDGLFEDPLLAFVASLAEEGNCPICGRGPAGADGRCAACVEFLDGR